MPLTIRQPIEIELDPAPREREDRKQRSRLAEEMKRNFKRMVEERRERNRQLLREQRLRERPGLAEAFAPARVPIEEAQRRAFQGVTPEAARLEAGAEEAREFGRAARGIDPERLKRLNAVLEEEGVTNEQFTALVSGRRDQLSPEEAEKATIAAQRLIGIPSEAELDRILKSDIPVEEKRAAFESFRQAALQRQERAPALGALELPFAAAGLGAEKVAEVAGAPEEVQVGANIAAQLALGVGGARTIPGALARRLPAGARTALDVAAVGATAEPGRVRVPTAAPAAVARETARGAPLETGGVRRAPVPIQAVDDFEVIPREAIEASARKRPPLGGAGEQFAAPLRPFDDVAAEVVTRDDPIAQALARSGVNPSLLETSDVGRATVAFGRQRGSTEQIINVTLASAVDSHRAGIAGRLPIAIGDDAIATLQNGRRVPWNDLFSTNRFDNELSPAQRAFVGDYRRVVDEVEFLRTQAGLAPRALKGAKAKEGWFYIPRQVRGIRGMELRRPANPGLQRHYEEALEGIKNGIDYEADPRAVLELHLRQAYREIAEKQLSDFLEPLSVAPSELIPEGLTARLAGAKKRQAVGTNAILAIQRAKRGEQLPTGTIKSIENVFPEVAGELSPASRITLEDLIRAGKKAAEPPVELPVPTPGTLKKLQRLLNEAVETAQANPGNAAAQKKASHLASQLGFAKFRFAKGEPFLLEAHPVKTLRGIQTKALDELLVKIRGVPTKTRTSTGRITTRFRGGLVEPLGEELRRAQGARTRALEAARKAELAPGNLFGKAEDVIPIGQWRNRFFPLEDAERLNEALGAFLQSPQRANWVGRGFEQLGNHIRFLSAIGDFAAPFIQGLPLLGRNPVAWSRATWRHYQAFADPTIQAKFIREHIDTFQEMAQHNVPIGDVEFFKAIQEGQGISAGALIERLPKGTQARNLLRQTGKQTFGRFQASYDMFLSSARAQLWESMRPTWQGSLDELAAHVRNMTGGLDSKALGVGPTQRGFESTWLAFSPRLLRSTVALVGDLRLGLTNPRGRAAYQALGGLTAGTVGMYIAAGMAMGRSEEEIRRGLNPLEGKKFLAYNINGDWVGVGGQVRAITQLLARSAADPSSLLEAGQFDNPLLQFAASRGAPGLRIAQTLGEAATGADLLPFDDIDSLPDMFLHIGQSALPFAVQGLLEGEGAGTFAFGLAGARTSPETRFETLTNARQQAMDERGITGSFDDLRRNQPDIALEIDRDPRVVEAQRALSEQPARTQVGEGFKRLEETGAEFRGRQQQDDDNLRDFFQSGGQTEFTPQIYGDNARERARELANRRDQIRQDFEIEFAERVPDPGTVGAAIGNYFAVDIEDFTDPLTGEIDWGPFNDAQDRALSGLSDQQREGALGVIRKNQTDIQRAFRELRDEPDMDEYWDIPSEDRQARERFRANHPRVDAILFITGTTTKLGPRGLEAANTLVRRLFGSRASVPRTALREQRGRVTPGTRESLLPAGIAPSRGNLLPGGRAGPSRSNLLP